MEITAKRMLRFNLGRYEEHVIEVGLTGIPEDADPEAIAEQLDLLMAPEVARAELATTHHPDDNVTSVYAWKNIIENTREGADA